MDGLQRGEYLPVADRLYEAPRPGGVRAEFYIDATIDEAASIAAGRQIWRDIERVKIYVPGAVTNVHVKAVDDNAKQRWPREYEAFKKGVEAPVEGTPIEQWPMLRPAMVAELRTNYKIRTVEEVAELSDVSLQKMSLGAWNLREHARAYLKEADRLALTSSLQHTKELLESRCEALERQVSELGQMLQRYETETKRAAERPHPLATSVPGQLDPLEWLRAAAAMMQQGNGQLPGQLPLAAATPAQGPVSALDAMPPVRRRVEDAELPIESPMMPPLPPASGDGEIGVGAQQ